MRDFGLVVPGDCIASNTPEDNAYALKQMNQVLKADTTDSANLDLQQLLRKDREDEKHPQPQTDKPTS